MGARKTRELCVRKAGRLHGARDVSDGDGDVGRGSAEAGAGEGHEGAAGLQTSAERQQIWLVSCKADLPRTFADPCTSYEFSHVHCILTIHRVIPSSEGPVVEYHINAKHTCLPKSTAP